MPTCSNRRWLRQNRALPEDRGGHRGQCLPEGQLGSGPLAHGRLRPHKRGSRRRRQFLHSCQLNLRLSSLLARSRLGLELGLRACSQDLILLTGRLYTVRLWALEAAPKPLSELDLCGDLEGGTDLTLLTDDLVRLGLKEGPEASEAKECKLLAAFTHTVDLLPEISRGQIPLILPPFLTHNAKLFTEIWWKILLNYVYDYFTEHLGGCIPLNTLPFHCDFYRYKIWIEWWIS